MYQNNYLRTLGSFFFMAGTTTAAKTELNGSILKEWLRNAKIPVKIKSTVLEIAAMPNYPGAM